MSTAIEKITPLTKLLSYSFAEINKKKQGVTLYRADFYKLLSVETERLKEVVERLGETPLINF
jgi:hypothetical protein